MVPPLRGLEEEEDGAGGGGNEEEESLPDLDGPGVPLFPAEYVLAAVWLAKKSIKNTNYEFFIWFLQVLDDQHMQINFNSP